MTEEDELFHSWANDTLAVVLAFDPGGTTGWCFMAVEPDVLMGGHSGMSLRECLILNLAGEIDCADERAGVDEMVGIFGMMTTAAVVIEDFILDVHKATMQRNLLSPVRLTAAFIYTIGKEANVFVQHRSLAKTTCTDERLKNWGLYNRYSGDHARDATRHAVYFLRSCMVGAPNSANIRHKAWPHLFGEKPDQETDSDIDGPSYRRLKMPGDRIPGLG